MPLLNRLKEHRSKLGMNQTELGKLAGVSRQTISLIERGDYSPSVTLALKLAMTASDHCTFNYIAGDLLFQIKEHLQQSRGC